MKQDYSQIIINRILSLCKDREITVNQLSKMSNVSHSTLDNIVNRKTSDPQIRTLHKIAIGFGMTLAEFLNFDQLNQYSFDD